MITLITLLLFGILAALFATQNTGHTSMMFASHAVNDIPLYLIVFGSILFGLLLSSLITLINSISSSLTIHGKNVKIKESKKTVAELNKRIDQLEVENERLKAKKENTGAVDRI